MTVFPQRALRAIAFVPLFAAATAALAGPPASPSPLRAERAWMRATPPNAPVAGGFLTLRNDGAVDDRLLSIDSADAQRVEIHEMRMDGGMMRMRRLADGIAVPAHGAIELRPGGQHLMFIGPTRSLKAGDTVNATLRFEHAAPQEVRFAVQPLGATAPPPEARTP